MNNTVVAGFIDGMKSMGKDSKDEIRRLVELITGERLIPTPPVLDPTKTYLFVPTDAIEYANWFAIMPAGGEGAFCINRKTYHKRPDPWTKYEVEQFLKLGLWIIAATI